MGKAYSIDLRRKVLQMLGENNASISQIARMFKISRKTIYSWMKPSSSRSRGRPRKLTDLSAIWELLRRNPLMAASELALYFQLSRQTIYSYLHKLQALYKKKLIGKRS